MWGCKNMDDHEFLNWFFKLESKVNYIETNYATRANQTLTEEVTQKIIDKLVDAVGKDFRNTNEKVKMLEDRIIRLDKTIEDLRWNMGQRARHFPCEICTKYAEHWKSP
jgi:hypothetical protein